MDSVRGYKLVRELGTGYSGTAYLVESPLGPAVMRKCRKEWLCALSPSLTDAVRRAAALRHPNLQRVYEVFEEHARVFIILEYFDGGTLETSLARGLITGDGPFRLLHRIAEALDDAHAQGVVHGDLQPSNIFLQAGEPRIADFAISRRALDPVGTACHPYLSPEHLAGNPLVPASDQYSLAMIAYLMLGGTPGSWCGSEIPAVPGVSSVRQGHFERAFHRDPHQRFGSCQELVAALEGVRASEPVRPRDVGSITAALSLGGKPAEAKPTDENVRFTAYRPSAIESTKWYPLLVFAHLSDSRPDAPPGTPNPVEEVARQAFQVLGDDIERYQNSTQDSAQGIPREGEITLLPRVEGIEFNPPSRSFQWTEEVHREEFRMRSRPDCQPVVRGRLSVFLGRILLAEVTLVFQVGDAGRGSKVIERSSAAPLRRIFASYSRKDMDVVEEFERHARWSGDDYLRDLTRLRSGEVWEDGLKRMIREAQVFQLFWSTNAMNSKFVEMEWRYASELRREGFIRPIYWEEPMPETPDHTLPPETLRRLHFQKIELARTPRSRLIDSAVGRELPPRASPQIAPSPATPAPPAMAQAPRPIPPAQASPVKSPPVVTQAPPSGRVSGGRSLKWAATGGVSLLALMALSSQLPLWKSPATGQITLPSVEAPAASKNQVVAPSTVSPSQPAGTGATKSTGSSKSSLPPVVSQQQPSHQPSPDSVPAQTQMTPPAQVVPPAPAPPVEFTGPRLLLQLLVNGVRKGSSPDTVLHLSRAGLSAGSLQIEVPGEKSVYSWNLTADWFVDGKLALSTSGDGLPFRSQFGNLPVPGKYEVRLLVRGQLSQILRFEIDDQ